MRPSWDWEHGSGDVSSGTPGHSREPEDHSEEPESLDEDESFFQAGDEGRYEGGPALLLTEAPVELDEAPLVAAAVRTPEQDARRARLVRVVAMAVGAFAALFAFGVVKQRKADASPERASANVAATVETPTSQRRDVTPLVVEKPAAAPAAPTPEPAAELEKIVAPEAKPEAHAAMEKQAKQEKRESTIAKATSFMGASIPEAPSTPASKPVVTTSVTAIPQGQTTGGGNVGNFASKGPGSDTPRPSTPTASFPVQ